jgi:hypothetical protein
MNLVAKIRKIGIPLTLFRENPHQKTDLGIIFAHDK